MDWGRGSIEGAVQGGSQYSGSVRSCIEALFGLVENGMA